MNIYFHHISKTAGMSFRRYLLEQLGDANVSPLLRRIKYSDAMREYGRFVAIGGHVTPVPGDRLAGDRLAITFIRDPIKRALSEYAFLRTVHSPGRERVSGHADAIDDWFDAQFEEDRLLLNAHLQALWGFGWDRPGKPTLGQMVEAAKTALDRFDLVGLQDHFDESVAHFAKRLAWPAPAALRRENETPVRASINELSDAVLGRLHRWLEPDYEIYRHALVRFGTQRQWFDQGRVASEGTAASGAGESFGTGLSVAATARPSGPVEAGVSSAAAEPERDTAEREIGIVHVGLQGIISGGTLLLSGEMAMLEVQFEARVSEPELTIGFSIQDYFGAPVFGTNTRLLGENLAVEPGIYSASFQFRNDLGLGLYRVSVALHRGETEADGSFERRDAVLGFEVVDVLTEPFDGRSRLHTEVTVHALSPQAKVISEPSRGSEAGGVWKLGQRNPVLASFACEVVQEGRLDAIPCSSDHLVQVRIRNPGVETWRAFGKRSVRVSYHWSDAEGRFVEYEGLRTLLPRDIAGGEFLTVPCFLRAPDAPGRYLLMWTLVQESVVWFNEKDAESQFTSAVVVTG